MINLLNHDGREKTSEMEKNFKEIRDLVNSLRGQVSGATNGIERIVARIEDLEARLEALEESNEELARLLGTEE